MRPSARLVRLCAFCALATLATAVSSWLTGPAALALATLLACALWDVRRARSEPPVEVAQEFPGRFRLGERAHVRYRIHNPCDRPIRLHLLDERGPAFAGDLLLGPVALAPHATTELLHTWLPMARGRQQLGPIYGLVSSPLGLFERRILTRADRPILSVVPNPAADRERPLGKGDEAGERPERTRGIGTSFDALRPYAEGDDPRHVDVRASARAGHLIVRTYREERNQRLVIAVDSGRMMAARIGALTKLDHALNTSIALADAASKHGDRLGFVAFDASLRGYLDVDVSHGGRAQLLEATTDLTPRPHESSYRVLTEVLEQRQKKRALVVILTDFIESADALALEGYLARLARRHVVLLVALRDELLSELDVAAPSLNEQAVYRRLVLQDLAGERERVLKRLTRLGVHTLDLRPEESRAPVLARYLSLRRAL